jgi:hypothetical protein
MSFENPQAPEQPAEQTESEKPERKSGSKLMSWAKKTAALAGVTALGFAGGAEFEKHQGHDGGSFPDKDQQEFYIKHLNEYHEHRAEGQGASTHEIEARALELVKNRLGAFDSQFLVPKSMSDLPHTSVPRLSIHSIKGVPVEVTIDNGQKIVFHMYDLSPEEIKVLGEEGLHELRDLQYQAEGKSD